MGRCSICGEEYTPLSRALGVCLDCLRQRGKEALPVAMEAHRQARRAFGLPEEPPRHRGGARCNICVNECEIGPGELGYCGLRKNRDGILTGVTSERGKLSWYHDPLPTNCVADWVCAGGTGAGYPRYALKRGPEYGFKNLAVFFHACTFDCLFCQNWHYREYTLRESYRTVEELVDAVDSRTTCICYFGGDPTAQLPFAIRASREALKRVKGRPLRICWETNGTMNRALLKQMLELSLQSGGTIKFDLKAWNENVHIALTGVTNRRTLDNFSFVADSIGLRPELPLLVASTLLVPGYIDEEEIRGIATFVASLSPDIPYSLLAFYPHFYMDDLGLNTREFAMRMVSVAKEAGVRNVRLGNVHLLR